MLTDLFFRKLVWYFPNIFIVYSYILVLRIWAKHLACPCNFRIAFWRLILWRGCIRSSAHSVGILSISQTSIINSDNFLYSYFPPSLNISALDSFAPGLSLFFSFSITLLISFSFYRFLTVFNIFNSASVCLYTLSCYCNMIGWMRRDIRIM